MSRPIAAASDGYLVGDGISPLSIGTDGNLVMLTIPIPEPEPEPETPTGPRIVGGPGYFPGLERRKRIIRDDDEVFAIIERFFQ
jgi:hypothetical protein